MGEVDTKAVKVDIISGFLGAGKTTLIRKLLSEALAEHKVVLIENEFGEIGVDGDFLQEAGVEIREMNSGCICCSLVGDFKRALEEVIHTYQPERVIIEPSGVGKLSEVVQAVEHAGEGIRVTGKATVVDVNKCKMYLKNFGEFFLDQVREAGLILLSRTGNAGAQKVEQAVDLLRQYNPDAVIVTTPWDQLDGRDILSELEQTADFRAALLDEVTQTYAEHHHHHHGEEEDEEEHEHHHHHHGEDEDEDEEEHEHHHHHHGEDEDEDEEEHEHHHHHHGEDEDEDEEEHEHHHHHHHADEIFTSWGMETPKAYPREQLQQILDALSQEERYGTVLRAKGMLPDGDGGWIYFDYVPEECELRSGKPAVTGKICVIGSHLKENALQKLFAI